MRALWSQMEEAWRDTLVHRAEGDLFYRQTTLLGFEFPVGEASEPDWARAFHLMAYGRRGTFEVTYRALEHVFAPDNIVVAGTVDSALPNVLTSTAVGGWGTGDELVNRLVRVGDLLLFTVRRVGVDMYVAAMGTHYWNAPVWEHSGVTQLDFTVLPFVVHERQPGVTPNDEEFSVGEECLFEVIYFVRPETVIPVTYIISPSNYGTPNFLEGDSLTDPGDVATPAGIPVRGEALLDETVVGRPDDAGPYPLYAYDGNIFPAIARQFSRTLAASVEMRIVANPPL